MTHQFITNPKLFFERRVESGLAVPVVVVSASVLAAILVQVVYAQHMTQSLPESIVTHILALSFLTGVFTAMVGPILEWLLLAGVFHTISVFLGGTGRFKNVLAATGWGFVPQVLYSLALLGALWFSIGGIGAPDTTAEVEAFRAALANEPVYSTVTSIRPAFLVWSGFLWTLGVREARNLSLYEALITVGVPVGVLLGVELV